MKPIAQVDSGMAETAYSAFEAVPGALDSGALIICDHASNAIPPGTVRSACRGKRLTATSVMTSAPPK
jgi:hypothetical protein